LFAAGFAAVGATPLAAALTEGVLQAMTITKMKLATAALLAVALVSGVGGLLAAGEADADAPVGMVKAVDPAKNELVVQVARGGKKVDQVFALPKGVPVVVGGKPAKLVDLRPGMRVGLNMGKDRKGVVAVNQLVQAKGADEKDKGDGQNGNKDDGQKGDGQNGNKDDGEKGNKDDGQKGDGQNGNKDDGEKGDGKKDGKAAAGGKAVPKVPVVARKR
jgi:hypothetical protein